MPERIAKVRLEPTGPGARALFAQIQDEEAEECARLADILAEGAKTAAARETAAAIASIIRYRIEYRVRNTASHPPLAREEP